MEYTVQGLFSLKFMEHIKLEKVSDIRGSVNLPGSKSLSNRALLLAALARGTTRLTNLLDSDDVRRMLEALQELGVRYTLSEDRTACIITGQGGKFNTGTSPVNSLELFLGNAGTAMRPITAVLALSDGEFILTGEHRMYERPIRHLVDALRQAGADITYLKTEGYPPLKITGRPLHGGEVEIDGSISSQYITAFLMAAPLMNGTVNLKIRGELVSRPYLDITIEMMKDYGVEVVNNDYKSFIIAGNQQYVAPKQPYLVEGDASAASYFLAAAAIKGRVKVTGIGRGSIQGDVKFAEYLEMMGAKVEFFDDHIICEHGELFGIDVDLNRIPDAAMTIAVLALFAKGKTVIRNIYNWRVKETDRLSAMATELRKVGAVVTEGRDYLEIEPPEKFLDAEIDTYNDHRMAMCFSLVALGHSVTINNPGCVSKTFPNYFSEFSTICC